MVFGNYVFHLKSLYMVGLKTLFSILSVMILKGIDAVGRAEKFILLHHRLQYISLASRRTEMKFQKSFPNPRLGWEKVHCLKL